MDAAGNETEKEVGDVDMDVDSGAAATGDKASDIAIVVDDATPAPETTPAGDKANAVTPTAGSSALVSTAARPPTDARDSDVDDRQAKRRRLNEIRRYDVDSGGAVGVGMGTLRDDDRVVIDDLDPK